MGAGNSSQDDSTPLWPPANMLFYHGGPPGLSRIEPRLKTGVDGYTVTTGWGQFFASGHRVYVTDQYRVAAMYAALWAARTNARFGCVYVVRPGGELDIDFDMETSSTWSCGWADVIEVVGPVRVSRLPRLVAWHKQWEAKQPLKLVSEDDWRGFYDRTVRRAVRDGWDEATVIAMLEESPISQCIALAAARDAVAAVTATG